MVWIALAFLVVAAVSTATLAVLRGLRAWRGFKALSGGVSDALGDVTRRAGDAEAHVVGIAEGGARLAAAAERLQRSLDELAVLRVAASEPGSLVRSLRNAVPRA